MPKFEPIAVALETLRFLVRRWLAIVRLTWVPMTLAFIAGVAVGAVQGDTYWGSPLGAEYAAYLVENLTVADAALLLLQAPMVAMTAVAVHRLVLFNDERPAEAFPFSFGRTDGLYLVMGLVLGTLMFVIDAIVAFVVLHVGAPAWSFIASGFSAVEDVPPGAYLAAFFLSYTTLVILLARVIVWPAGVVARSNVSWQESWALSKGRWLPLAGLVVFSIVVSVAFAYFTFWIFASALSTGLIADDAARFPVVLAASLKFWLFTVFWAALASFTYKALRGYRSDEDMPR